ncbi:MAG: hypothetical protein EP309_09020 [Gammaproteobacteria bacterium]|nr:MAG: hypothetical protein EP309_09020 [Gammaproteobacteria bacterium]
MAAAPRTPPSTVRSSPPRPWTIWRPSSRSASAASGLLPRLRLPRAPALKARTRGPFLCSSPISGRRSRVGWRLVGDAVHTSQWA